MPKRDPQLQVVRYWRHPRNLDPPWTTAIHRGAGGDRRAATTSRCSLRAMRILSIAALLLALAAPAALAKPFGKPRTLGTTPPAYDYDGLFTAAGPDGGVAFYAPGEKQVGLKITQRLYLARV